MARPETQAISLRIRSEKVDMLERLAKSTDRPRSWHIEQALDAYLELQAWQIARVKEGIADADSGRLIPHEQIEDWLKTWGSDEEGEPPV